jgi:protein CsiD
MIVHAKSNTDISVKKYKIWPDSRNSRISQIVIDADALNQFCESASVEELNYGLLDAFKYVPFAKRELSRLLLTFLGESFKDDVLSVLQDYEKGGLIVNLQALPNLKHRLWFITALSFLIGNPRSDANGSHLAHFEMTDLRKDDPPLLNPYFILPFHTDGTFFEGDTDWILMLKTIEEEVIGGESNLLHLEDWAEWERFKQHKLANHRFIFRGPSNSDYRRKDIGSRGDTGEVERPFFFTHLDNSAFRFTFQWVHPRNTEEAKFIRDMHISLMHEMKLNVFPLAVNELYCVNNRIWLHGRLSMQPSNNLRREAYRIIGSF